MNAGIADPEVRKKKLNAERLGAAGGFRQNQEQMVNNH
jgi:hypothetical protein